MEWGLTDGSVKPFEKDLSTGFRTHIRGSVTLSWPSQAPHSGAHTYMQAHTWHMQLKILLRSAHDFLRKCFVCVCTVVCTMLHMWRSAGNLWKLVLSIYYRGLRDLTWIIRLGSKSLYLLRHLSGWFQISWNPFIPVMWTRVPCDLVCKPTLPCSA